MATVTRRPLFEGFKVGEDFWGYRAPKVDLYFDAGDDCGIVTYDCEDDRYEAWCRWEDPELGEALEAEARRIVNIARLGRELAS